MCWYRTYTHQKYNQMLVFPNLIANTYCLDFKISHYVTIHRFLLTKTLRTKIAEFEVVIDHKKSMPGKDN